MTRCTRFTPFVFAGVFAAGLAGARRADAVELPLVAQPTVNAGTRVFDLTQGDIDRDGDVDLVSASRSVPPVPYTATPIHRRSPLFVGLPRFARCPLNVAVLVWLPARPGQISFAWRQAIAHIGNGRSRTSLSSREIYAR